MSRYEKWPDYQVAAMRNRIIEGNRQVEGVEAWLDAEIAKLKELRDEKLKDVYFVQTGIRRTHTRIAENLCRGRDKNIIKTRIRIDHHNYKEEYKKPDRVVLTVEGIRLEWDWEDRGYTENYRYLVNWHDIFVVAHARAEIAKEKKRQRLEAA